MKKFTSYLFTILFSATTYFSVGANFYSQDFSGGIPGTWQNVDSALTGVKWRWTLTGAFNNTFPFSNALSTSGTTAANGYVIFDSDSAYPTAGDALLITSAINCAGKSNVHLTFNEYFAQWNSSIGLVSVSNDGTNWVDIHNAEAGLSQDQTTSNPNAVDIDISTVADNKATVYVRFRYTGAGEYFWMVDDIGLYQNASFDGGVTGIASPGSSCALLSNAEKIKVNIHNFGADTLFNVPVSYVVDAMPAVNETADTIPAGATLAYTFTATANLSVPGYHTIKSYTGVASDADNSNDSNQVKIFNGPHVVNPTYTQGFEVPAEDTMGWLAVDGNTDGNTWDLSNQFPRSGSMCAAFTADLPSNAANDWFFTPCLGLADSTSTYYELYFWYRSFVGYNAIMEVRLCTAQSAASAIRTIVPSTTISNTSYAFSGSVFGAPANAVYYIGWHVTNSGANYCSLKIDDINLHTSTVTSVPVASKNSQIKVYPNPGNGTFYIANLKSFGGMVQVAVYDMMGKVVYNQNVTGEDQLTMNLENQSAGIYTVRVSSETQVITKQISITK